MLNKFLLTGFCLLLAVVLATARNGIDPELFLKPKLKPLKDSAQRIAEHGYPSESHFTETSDGYVLNLFRIPYSHKLQNQNQRRPAVLIQHGLFSCSESFLLNGPDNAITYNFADAGFDVWLGNARGNIYSRNNTKLSVDNPRFWDFSWDEIGAIDIAQMVDYILETTGEKQIHYVGHSQGGTVFFVFLSSRPEYNSKVATAHLLAPAVFMGNSTTGVVTQLGPIFGVPGKKAMLMESREFLPANPTISRLLDTFCGGEPLLLEQCRNLFLWYAGTEQNNMNKTLVPQIAETHPSGISSNQGIHFLQSHMFNTFSRYHHGEKKNLKRYNQEKPPEYPVQKITTDVNIYYGLNDGSANKLDIQRLVAMLPKVNVNEMENPTWGHLDFIFATEVKKYINDPVIAYCKAYEEKKSTNTDTKYFM